LSENAKENSLSYQRDKKPEKGKPLGQIMTLEENNILRLKRRCF
jgi:hypothetical protein